MGVASDTDLLLALDELARHRTDANPEEALATDLRREFSAVIKHPPHNPGFDPARMPTLLLLAQRWRQGRGGDRAAVAAALRAAFRRLDPRAANFVLLAALLPLDPEDPKNGVSIENRRRSAGRLVRPALSTDGVSHRETRQLIPDLAGGLAAAVRDGPSPADYPPVDPQLIRRAERFLDEPQARFRRLLALDAERSEGPGPSWAPDDPQSRWFGPIWAWWWSPHGVPAERWEFEMQAQSPDEWEDVYALTTDADLALVRRTRDKRHIAVVGLSQCVGDNANCGIAAVEIEYPLVKAIERLKDRGRLEHNRSAYGRRPSGRPWPGFLVAHVTIETNDGWVLLARRNRHTRPDGYLAGHWSASFEEQVDIGVEGKDANVAGCASRGLREELNLEAYGTRCFLIGRESALQPGGATILNAAAICSARVRDSIDEVWTKIREAPDGHEHDAWAAIKVSSAADLDKAMTTGTTFESWARALNVDVRTPPDQPDAATTEPILWHPTSYARLLFWSAAAVRAGRIANTSDG